MKAATDATLRMPPRRRSRLSTKASDKSASARTLRSIIASCSLRLSLRGGTEQAETGIVDHDLRLDAEAAIASPMSAAASPLSEVGANNAASAALRRDRVGELGEPLLAARHQHEVVAVAREHLRQRRAETGRRTGDQRDRTPFSHGRGPVGLAATRWRSSMRVREGTCSRVGGAPDQVVLEFGDPAVGIGDLPHHLDDL